MKGFEFPDTSDSEEKIQNDEITNNYSVDTNHSEIEDSFKYEPIEFESEEVNNNPYEETTINTNPYQNVNIEDVISREDQIYEEKEEKETYTPKSLSDDEMTDIEIAKIKAERSLKIKNLRTAFVVFMFVVLVALVVVYSQRDKEKDKVKIDPIDIRLKDKNDSQLDFSAELNNYYQTREKANVEKALVDSASDSEKIQSINNTAVNQIDKIIDDIIYTSKDNLDYEKKMTDLEEYISSLNAIRFNEAVILKDTDYNAIKEKISLLKESSTEYFTGLSYYNSKDYNNAYTVFSSVPEDNYFYKVSNSYIDKITDEIISLLNSDIANISTNLDYLDTAEKKLKYNQIKSIIEQYNKAYPYLHLETNQTYNDLLQKYTELSE